MATSASTTATPQTQTQPTAPAPATPSFASASVYVGELAPEVTEAVLFEVFNAIGPVASIRVCRDAITRRSLGYAYVNFHTVGDAERAIEQLNNSPIRGKPCRIMWSQRDPSLRKSGRGNIFIKNLDKSIDHKALFDTFSQFGPILSCKIELDEENGSRGYGYIQYANTESADRAVDKVNGMMLAGKKVFVGPFVPRKERVSQTNKKFTNIYVNNLEASLSDDELKSLFTEYGNIKSAVIMRDEAGKSKGFGFINFDTPEEAEKAVQAMNGKDLKGKALYVGRAQKKTERESELRNKFEQLKMEHMQKYQGVNLYIKNLDDETDDDKLRAIFSVFGPITSARVMKDKGVSKGFGFVCFSTPEEATRAVTEMNGKIIGSKPLYVALAQRKEVRKAQLEAQFAARAKGMPPRLPTAPMYNIFYQPGQPVVYPPPNMMQPRGRGFPPGPYGQPMPNYVVVGQGGRGGNQGVKNYPRGGGMVSGPRRGGRQQQMNNPAPQAPQEQAVPNSAEEQKLMLGEKLYNMIVKNQPQLAGKITGMILESSQPEEIIQLIEVPASLNEKVQEAIKVLNEYNQKK